MEVWDQPDDDSVSPFFLSIFSYEPCMIWQTGRPFEQLWVRATSVAIVHHPRCYCSSHGGVDFELAVLRFLAHMAYAFRDLHVLLI